MIDSGGAANRKNPLNGLTDKQVQVLDLLIEHKTSKEISRALGISPHTVDQRINTARQRLGASSRGQVAAAYRQLRETCEKSIYEFSYMAGDAYSNHPLQRDIAEATDDSGSMERSHGGSLVHEPLDFRVGPELFEGRWGTMARLGAIIALAAFMAIAILGGMSIFLTLSRLAGY